MLAAHDGSGRRSPGVDIAKEAHWVTVIDAHGVVRIDRKADNTPGAIAALIADPTERGGSVRIGLDVVGGIAGLAEAMLAAAGFALVHVPGLAVNRARQGTVGGEHKSDPRDARVIAEQVRPRQDRRPLEPATEVDLELRLLVGRRRDLVEAQTQRLARLHDLLVGIFPGLERGLDLTTKGPLVLLSKFITLAGTLMGSAPASGALNQDTRLPEAVTYRPSPRSWRKRGRAPSVKAMRAGGLRPWQPAAADSVTHAALEGKRYRPAG